MSPTSNAAAAQIEYFKAPARMRRFVGMVESAWNLTESYRPMALLSDADRERLHADHGEMLSAFVERDSAALLTCAAAHHQRLLDAVAASPPGDAFAEEQTSQKEHDAPCPSM